MNRSRAIAEAAAGDAAPTVRTPRVRIAWTAFISAPIIEQYERSYVYARTIVR
jgi:hypothetical protein